MRFHGMFFGVFDGSDISTHQERVLLLLKVRFRIEFFDTTKSRETVPLNYYKIFL
jgi:hypothetical protein